MGSHVVKIVNCESNARVCMVFSISKVKLKKRVSIKRVLELSTESNHKSIG